MEAMYQTVNSLKWTYNSYSQYWTYQSSLLKLMRDILTEQMIANEIMAQYGQWYRICCY